MATRMRDWEAVPDGGDDSSSPVGGYFRWHAKYYFAPILSLVAIFLVALAIAYGYAKNGNLGGIGTIMMIAVFAVILVGFMWGNMGFFSILTYIDGNIGGVKDGKEDGASVSDGVKAVKTGLRGYGKKVLVLGIYTAVPFVALFILTLLGSEHVEKALWILPASFLIMVGVLAFWPGSAFAKFIIGLCIAGVIFVFGYAVWQWGIKQYAVQQEKQAASAPINERAEREAKEAKLSYLREQAASCAKAIAASWKAGKPPTSEAEADCRKKQEAAREAEGTTSSLSWPSLPKFGSSSEGSTAAGAINSPAPATPQATPAPAPAAKPAPAIQVVWEGYYAPSVHRGPMSIGSHPAGQYRVEGEGLRQQVDPNNHGHYRSHDWRGEVVSEGGRCIVIVPNPGQMSIPFTGPGQCYGAVIVTAENSTHHWVADRKCFDHRGGELFVNANNGAHPDRFTGQGGHKLRLTQC